MADNRFTPDELRELVTSGELTPDDLPLLDMRDARVAMSLLQDSGGLEVMGQPMAPPAAVKGIQGIGDFIGYLTGFPGLGSGRGPSRSKPVPQSAPRPSTPGRANVPPSGKPPLSTKYYPAKGEGPGIGWSHAAKNADPPNLNREGNLTRPGPRGPGSPSAPPGGGGVKVEGMGSKPVERRSPGGERFERPVINKGTQEGFNKRHDELLDKFGGTAGKNNISGSSAKTDTGHQSSGLKRQSPTEDFDEADKREVMFGGAGDMSKPSDRGPIKRGKVVRRRAK